MRFKFRLIIILISILGISFGVYYYKQSNSVSEIVNQIAEINMVCGSAVGRAASEPEQWRNYLKLKKWASIEELIRLTNHKNPAVRCYAFLALVEKKDSHCFAILLNHLKDNEVVDNFYGCIRSSAKVGDMYISFLGHKSRLLTDNQREQLQNQILYDSNVELEFKSQLLKDIKPKKEYYERIKKIAIDEKNPYGLIALARYQNPNDKELIKKEFEADDMEYYAIWAVMEYPDEYFYNNLIKVFEKEWNKELYDYKKWRILYQALSRYPNEKTLELFNQTLQCDDNFRYQTLGAYLLAAITEYPNIAYESIKEKIKLDALHMEEVKLYLKK